MLPPKAKWWIGSGLLGLGAVLSFFLLTRKDPAFEVTPGEQVRRELGGDESSHDYRLPLAPEEVVDIVVEQHGIDVALILLSPEREELLSLDSPTGNEGPERLFAVAEAGGTYRLRIAAGPGDRGSYVLRLGEPRRAEPRDQLRARAFQEYSQGDALRRKGTGDDRHQARVHFGIAFDLWYRLGDRDQQLVVLRRQCPLLRDLGLSAEAMQAHRWALSLARAPLDRVFFLNSFSVLLLNDFGDARRALAAGEEALALASQAGNLHSEAAAFNNLGRIYRSLGENDKALKYFDRSLESWAKLELHRGTALTLSNKAETLLAIGSPKPAVQLLKDALRVQKEIGDQTGEPLTHRTLGWAFQMLGNGDLGLGELELAHKTARETGNRQIEGLALSDIGSVRLQRGEIGLAERAFTDALQIAREGGNLDGEAYAQAGLGKALLERGDTAGALARFARSEELFSRLGNSNALSMVLHSRALAERRQGRLKSSLESIDRALALVEKLREEVSQSALQLHVIGPRTALYDLKVDLLLRLHERQPNLGYDAAAFEASEGRRARSLLEGVRRLGVGIPPALSRYTLRRQELLRFRLQRLIERKLTSEPQSQTGLDAEIRTALAEWDELLEEIRRQSPGYAAVAAPKLVGVPEVQELLDSQTALIAFTVGEERSVLWWIEKDVLVVHDLPPRGKLEPLASQVYGLISRPSTKQRELARARLEELGGLLLEPVVERLPRVRQLVIVADEVLQTLPFAALLAPGSAQPLVESHAVLQLPSASLAAVLRARQKGRTPSPQLVAVFADPVFGPTDGRLRQGRGAPGTTAPRHPPEVLARLPKSLDEANAILDLVPAARRRAFIGFDANRRAALDPELARYRYIHFATHGLVDLDNPSLSGIQLSRINPHGQPLEGQGLLPFYEVYNLSLPADLVTLSACKTAVGPQVRGEGVLGMSRSFLYAGATRVMGALWDVDDADAAELMILFYRGMLRDGLPPAFALQRAQKALRARTKRDVPYRWAGFVLQGDWL